MGLNDDGEAADIQTIEKAVKRFRHSSQIVAAAVKDSDYRKMIDQIDKYWEKLFADPITVTTGNGEQISIQPQRTNNILERFFRDLKRGYRKKTGSKSLGRTLKAMLADTPLVKNLSNPEYMQVLLDGKDTLELSFAIIVIIWREHKKIRQFCQPALIRPYKSRKLIMSLNRRWVKTWQLSF